MDQPNGSAMKGPHLERTASLITVSPRQVSFFFVTRHSPWRSSMPGSLDYRTRGGTKCNVPRKNHGGAPAHQTRRGIEPRPILRKTTAKRSATEEENIW